jgi:hypothetical protein
VRTLSIVQMLAETRPQEATISSLCGHSHTHVRLVLWLHPCVTPHQKQQKHKRLLIADSADLVAC